MNEDDFKKSKWDLDRKIALLRRHMEKNHKKFEQAFFNFYWPALYELRNQASLSESYSELKLYRDRYIEYKSAIYDVTSRQA